MRLTVGLGSIDQYVRFARAGADEFFCGYVPYSWSEKYGTVLPLNRREVLGCQVQLGAFEELKILQNMKKEYQKPVHLTFNSLYYRPEQYPEIAGIIEKCRKLGFESFILADPALMVYLREKKISCEIHLSGETGEVNRRMVEVFQRLDLKRIIFHRKNSFADMKSVVEQEKAAGGRRARTEFEAFALNEQCQFTGAFCSSWHCDEMGYLCRVPYQLGAVKKDGKTALEEMSEAEGAKGDEPGYLCGQTGCGLCGLADLKEVGITHLKLVGRGNHADFIERDIRNLKQALKILEESEKNTYRRQMKQKIFPEGCSGNCYYR